MRVICKKSMIGSDVRCPICGQGFVVFWQGRVQARQLEKKLVLQSLRMQHENGSNGAEVHPAAAFDVPIWDGAALGDAVSQQNSAAVGR
ncbi:hypothetical protein AciPR4_4225 [Terriglobus saanensis SP1PR4]|uniref:Uncharacterized protein n=1 Tax=Terriglobus saanensis (strain ATCC BAA-1853 / DSM 23119 / SP1PR4) TaxID=401053 RepID=E8V678_TERSS|nr:hypothetical protein AciPR4_4225 [Terriglobus saanensis SP1PR4]